MSGAVHRLFSVAAPSRSELIAAASSKDADNADVLVAAWRILHGHMPAAIGEMLPRGGFLDAALELCETVFGSWLRGWTLEYTTGGGPYRATLHLVRPDRTLTGQSDLSGAAAFVLAALHAPSNGIAPAQDS